MRPVSRLLVFACLLLASAGVRAQACAGFTDVSSGSQFCPNVEWLKNRAITLGCTSTTLYCPNDPVTRLSMAAFMNRLGRALAVEPLFVEQTTGAIPLTSGPAELRCVTADTAATSYPRSVILVGTMGGLADANPVAWRGTIHFSTDAGATWQSAGGFEGIRASSPASVWSNAAFVMSFDLDPNLPYRFAIGIFRDDLLASTGNLADGRCQLTAAVVNRNGAVTPYDIAKAPRLGSAP